MKRVLFLLLMASCSFIGCDKEGSSLNRLTNEANKNADNATSDSCRQKSLKSGNYGIYGEVLWPVSGTPYNAVDCPTVLIYKWVNGAWVYHGSAGASACGYYTYDTGGTGTFRALISGYYYMRSYPGCATRVGRGQHAGSGDGTVTIWAPWVVVNVRCS